MKGVEITYLIDPDNTTSSSTSPRSTNAGKGQRPKTVAGRPPRSRGQGTRRHLDRHAQPLARPDDRLGLPGGQGRLRREAVPATTSTRGGSPSKRPAKYDRIVQHGTQNRSNPASGRRSPRRSSRASTASSTSPRGLLLQVRARASGSSRDKPRARGHRLQPLDRPGPRAPVQREPGPLQLALVLGLRQRRHRQPGGPRDGQGPLADPRRDAAQERDLPSAAGSATTTRGDRQHPDRRSSTTAIPRSSSRSAACRPTSTAANWSATSPTSTRGRSPSQTRGLSSSPRAKRRPSRCPSSRRSSPVIDGREVALRQLHRRRPQPQGLRPQRRHPRRPLLGRPLPPGQHLVSPRRSGLRSTRRPKAVRRQQGRLPRLSARMEEHLSKDNGREARRADLPVGPKLTVDAKTRVVRRRPRAPTSC